MALKIRNLSPYIDIRKEGILLQLALDIQIDKGDRVYSRLLSEIRHGSYSFPEVAKLARTPLINPLAASCEYFFASSTASLMLTLSGISSANSIS